MGQNKLLVETSVACKVGTWDLPESEWDAVAQYLSASFDFVVSPLTFIEILNSIARGGEQFFVSKLKRLAALSPMDPLNPTFLEMPGQFVLREVLGGASAVETYKPWQMAEAMTTVLHHKSVSPELRAWLDEIQSNHQSGTANYVSSHDEMRRVGQIVPDRERWLRAKMRHLGILLLTAEEVQKLAVALDAAYRYAAWIRQELKNRYYQPSKRVTAWIDYQQLFYLCDPAIHILYVDTDFTLRTEGSSQQSRLLKNVWSGSLKTSSPTIQAGAY